LTDYVAYYRVSTAKQGKSGLGLSAQKTKVNEFLGVDDQIIDSFVEVQSGKNDNRKELQKALRIAKRENAIILIAKLDRFSRRVSFISGIMDQGIGLAVAELPNATDFQLHIFAALAQEERRLISERTKSALAEAKKRGVKLGRNGYVLAKRNIRESNIFAERLRSSLTHLRNECSTYSGIANRLNELGILTYRGKYFQPQTVKNYLIRLNVY
jgi:DNA invertase Pin-like site-specific DNA recombinase